jgi:effector-binding domain-containing protein
MTLSAVTLVAPPPIPVAVVRRQAKAAELARVVPECCGLAWKAVRDQNAKAGRNVAIYWDERIRVEAGVELAGPFTEQGEVVRSFTPSGPAVSVTHYGPYGGLGAAHAAIRGWCQSHGYRPTGPQWEIYGHWEAAWNADPSKVRTDIFYQVAPARAQT